MTGVVTPPEEIERLRKLGRAKKVSFRAEKRKEGVMKYRTRVGKMSDSLDRIHWPSGYVTRDSPCRMV